MKRNWTDSRHGSEWEIEAIPAQGQQASRPERLVLVQNFFEELCERLGN